MLELNIAGTNRLPSANWQLKLPSGITAIVGPSGAGKTSLLRAIAGLDDLRGGDIVLNDAPFNAPLEKRRVGMVFQEPRLLNHLSVRDNIVLDRKSTQSVEALAQALDILPLLDRSPASLSGGEQQRVMMARALYIDPSLMLFDEPLSAVDPALKSQLLTLVRTLFAKRDMPTLYVTHHMDEAAKIADHLLVMRDMKIIDFGPVAATMAGLKDDQFFDGGVSSLISGKVEKIEPDYALAHIKVGHQQIEVPDHHLHVDDEVRLRIWARDVLLAAARVKGLSARNQLDGIIDRIIQVDEARSDVIVKIEGEVLRARVMNKTIAELQFTPGSKVVAIFKSVSIE